MKLSIFIDKNREEEIIIYTHERNTLTAEIESLVNGMDTDITAYKDREIIKLKISDVYCFTAQNNKLYAITENDRLLLKYRLYSIEERLNRDFLKINKSCIANVKKIECFDASISGTLMVKFKNGYIDYVSRRSIKAVKERLGL